MKGIKSFKYGIKRNIALIFGITLVFIISSSTYAFINTCSNQLTIRDADGEITSTNHQQSASNKSLSDNLDLLLDNLPESSRNALADYEQYYGDFSESDRQALSEYEKYYKELMDTDKASLDAYKYFKQCWKPENTTFMASSEDIPNFDESFQSFFSKSWLQAPYYSPVAETSQNSDYMVFQDDDKQVTINYLCDGYHELVETTTLTSNQQIIEKSLITNGREINQKLTITGKPRVKLIEPDFPDLDTIIVPIRSREDTVETSDQGVRTYTFTVKMGWEIELPGFDYDLRIPLWMISFHAWARFECIYHFVFPVIITIEYPAEVFEGQFYTFNCTLKPVDLPDYSEYQVTFILDVGLSLDLLVPKLRWVRHGPYTRKILKRGACRYYSRWLNRCVKWYWKWVDDQYYIWSLEWQDEWEPLIPVPLIDIEFHKTANYTTPLSGDITNIPLGIDIDLLPILERVPYIGPVCSVLGYFMEMGISLGTLYVHGDYVSGKLTASAGTYLKTCKTFSWRRPNQKWGLTVGIPSSADKYLSLGFSDLIFHSKRADLNPEFFIRFKNMEVPVVPFVAPLPLYDWFDEIVRWPLPFGIPLGSFHLPSTVASYPMMNPAPSVASPEVYDFSMNVEKISPFQGQGTRATITTEDQLYRITLKNLAGRKDIVKLAVKGLPEGYKATFDRSTPHYEVGSTPTTVNLVISPPQHITEPPGERSFNILATSQGKENLGAGDATISKSAVLQIPEIADLTLEVDHDQIEVIQVDPGMYIPIKYYGKNLGNSQDTITVNAVLTPLHSDNTVQTWEKDFVVGPYGSGGNQYYSGEFGFSYDKNDLYPVPGVYKLEVRATSHNSPLLVKKQPLMLNFTAHHDLETAISPESVTMRANWLKNFTLTIINTGNALDNFTLVSDGWDGYLTFPNKIINLEPTKNVTVTITLEIPEPSIVPPDLYTFRITVLSDGSNKKAFSATDVQINLLPADQVPPGIVYAGFDPPESNLTLPQSPLDLGPAWLAFDEYPGNYTIYIDDEINGSGNWAVGTPVQVNMTGTNPQDLGLHNVTVTFNDTAGNSVVAQKWVTIIPEDTSKPLIQPYDTMITVPINFSSPCRLNWNFTEQHILNITLFRNETELLQEDIIVEQIPDGTSTYRTGYVLVPGNLSEGLWNYTLTILDLSNNTASSTILVNVTAADSTAPDLTTPISSANLGHNTMLSFTATDANPDRLEFWINSTLKFNDTWQSGVPIVFLVDELNLSVGVNNLEIRFYDLANNLGYYQWPFTLWDIDPPSLITAPSDFTVYEHNYSRTGPYWIVEDNDTRPGQYSIYKDGILVKTGNWTVGSKIITLPLLNLSRGTYIYNASFSDATGNTVYSSLTVTVKDVLAPYIWPIDPIHYEPLYAPSWLEFSITEPHLESYELYRNQGMIDEGPISSDFPFILIDFADLPIGNYSYTLRATDESGNSAEETVEIYVIDFTPPYIRKPADIVFSEGTTGHTIVWEILEANPHNYSLYLDNQLIESGILTTSNLTTSVDDLDLGYHEYILVVYDQFGLSHSSLCVVIVVDLTPITITHIGDCRFVAGDPNAKLVWAVTSIHPASYTLKRNGEIIHQETWTGQDIIIRLFNWPVGTHDVEIIVSDTSGNVVTDQVIVEIVTEEPLYTSTGSPSPGFDLLLALITIALLIPVVQKKRRKT